MDKRARNPYDAGERARWNEEPDMALPLAPIAGLALRYGAVAVAAYAAVRALGPGRLDRNVEDAMDETPEGLTLRRADGQANATARWTRALRVGHRGPGVEIDVTGLARVKLRRV